MLKGVGKYMYGNNWLQIVSVLKQKFTTVFIYSRNTYINNHNKPLNRIEYAWKNRKHEKLINVENLNQYHVFSMSEIISRSFKEDIQVKSISFYDKELAVLQNHYAVLFNNYSPYSAFAWRNKLSSN